MVIYVLAKDIVGPLNTAKQDRAVWSATSDVANDPQLGNAAVLVVVEAPLVVVVKDTGPGLRRQLSIVDHRQHPLKHKLTECLDAELAVDGYHRFSSFPG